MNETIEQLRRLDAQIAANEQQVQEVKTMWSVVRATFIGVALSMLWAIAVAIYMATTRPGMLASDAPVPLLLAILPMGVATVYCVVSVIWFLRRPSSIRNTEEALS